MHRTLAYIQSFLESQPASLAIPELLDRIRRNLSYSLQLLTGVCCFISLPIDHGVCFAAKGRMQTPEIVELDPVYGASLDLRSRFPGAQIGAFGFRAPHNRSTKMLSRNHPFPSIDIRMPGRHNRSFETREVNWLP